MKEKYRSGCKHAQAFLLRETRFRWTNSFSLLWKMNLTCYSDPISSWRIWRVKISKCMTPVWHGWIVRIPVLIHKLLLRKCLWKFKFTAKSTMSAFKLSCYWHTSVCPWIVLSENEVALRTREGHVLMFSLNNNLTTTLLDNSSLVSYSNTAHEETYQYWLTHIHRQLDKLTVQQTRRCFHIERAKL